MRIWLKRFGIALYFLVIALLLAPTLVPPFLDRIYYEGPVSDHFDGERFFNPGGDRAGFSEQERERPRRFRWFSDARAEWPDHVPVRRSVPPSKIGSGAMLVTWIGHASVLVQADGINILTDPLWSRRTSPFSFIGPERVAAPGVAFEDLPPIDIVLVSHNHYDHMDLATLKRLWARDRPLIVTSLGNDAILAAEGIEASARDWGEAVVSGPARVIVERNHHWSSRWGADRNRALWSAFTVVLPGGSIFFGGDTGYGDGSWIKEAAANGPFRLALIPIGAYEPRDFMRRSHVDPQEAVRIFEGLDPLMALGIHWGTVQLTFEPIDEPPKRLRAALDERGIDPRRFRAVRQGESFSVPAL